MRTLGDTIARLKSRQPAMSATSVLKPLTIQGPNPGALKAWIHVPKGLGPNPPLVVVLHGCAQTPAAYDAGSGWSAMADRHGFVVVYPEQQRPNNPSLCFNWFSPADICRDGGEAASIHSTIETAVQAHDVDRARVFVTGLSAGGAMTAVMLSTYPDVFRAGAVFAGLPYACAGSVPEALDRMRGHGLTSASALKAAVTKASTPDGPWPSLSVWHGTGDRTVVPANADALLDQWRGTLGLPLSPDVVRDRGDYTHRAWNRSDGLPALEDYRIRGMGHGVPINPRATDPVGAAGPYMLATSLSSTEILVETWGLARPANQEVSRYRLDKAPAQPTYSPEMATDADRVQPPHGSSVQTIIETALRRAGLMP